MKALADFTTVADAAAPFAEQLPDDPVFNAYRANFPLDVGTPEQTRKLYTDQRVFLTSYRHLLKTE